MLFVADERSLEALTAADFRDVLGTRFLLTASPPDGGPRVSFQAELANVTEDANGNPEASRAPFSLLFHGPLDPVLPQGIYRLEQERFGAIELFIVPIGPAEPAGSAEPAKALAMRYEAVFS